jgi:phosphogluconate dehydratase
MKLHPTIEKVTQRIRERSAPTRSAYLAQVKAASQRDRGADRMGCANVAHALAAMPDSDKTVALPRYLDAAALPANDKFKVIAEKAPNIGIVNAYNDMLSAHAPLAGFPAILKDELRKHGATAQVAGGVPAMCDGVTQGTAGMELSLFSRDNIAQGTAIALSHDVFDGALMLGVCDKIVPTTRKPRCASKRRRVWWAERNCSKQKTRPTTAWARARFTARPTATRCS